VANDEWTLSGLRLRCFADGNRPFRSECYRPVCEGEAGILPRILPEFRPFGASLANTVRGLGHSWANTYGFPLSLQALQHFDGVFVGGNAADNMVLRAYLQFRRQRLPAGWIREHRRTLLRWASRSGGLGPSLADLRLEA